MAVIQWENKSRSQYLEHWRVDPSKPLPRCITAVTVLYVLALAGVLLHRPARPRCIFNVPSPDPGWYFVLPRQNHFSPSGVILSNLLAPPRRCHATLVLHPTRRSYTTPGYCSSSRTSYMPFNESLDVPVDPKLLGEIEKELSTM